MNKMIIFGMNKRRRKCNKQALQGKDKLLIECVS